MPPLDTMTRGMISVAFRTVGCRLNQCETAQMQEALLAAGFKVTDWDKPADVRIVNTCTVTAKSDRTCRQEIHAAKRLDPQCLLAVTGCFAQVAPESVAAIPEVDLVLGNPDKQELAEHLATALRQNAATKQPTGSYRNLPAPGVARVAVSAYAARPAFETQSFAHFHGHTRAFLKIQTGCDCHCSYCIVPLARGPARSMLRDDVLAQVRLLTSRGYREIVLTGIDLGSWGRDTGEGSLADLLVRLLDNGPGRLRLSSVEPLEVDASLLEVIEQAGELVARHLHLPLQSGSDAVLRRMGRPYSAEKYLAVATSLAERLPDIALGADLIVGFPGETEAEFEQTLALIEAAPLTYLHVFGYSDRPGTAAVEMRPKIRPEIIKQRSERLRALGARKKSAFRARLVGSTQRVLVMDERADDGRLVGLTGNYLEVLVPGDESLINQFVKAKLDNPLPTGRFEVTILDREL